MDRIIGNGADKYERDKFRRIPSHYPLIQNPPKDFERNIFKAISESKYESVQYLIEQRKEIIHEKEELGLTPLQSSGERLCKDYPIYRCILRKCEPQRHQTNLLPSIMHQ